MTLSVNSKFTEHAMGSNRTLYLANDFSLHLHVSRYELDTYLSRFNAVLYYVIKFVLTVPPEIGYVSSDQDICEGSLVTLSCNATGSPTPSVTWTRVADNGTDSEPLAAMDGTHIMSSITRSSNGTYHCTAQNRVGTVTRTVQVTVRCK